MKTYLIASGDFVSTGGMDCANHALAAYLAQSGHQVHLVGYRVASDLAGHPNIVVHYVPKLAGSYSLSAAVFELVAIKWAKLVTRQGGRVVVNGGNCCWPDVNWVHYVHAAYRPQDTTTRLRRYCQAWAHRRWLTAERAALRRARLIIANSQRTKRDLVTLIGIPKTRIEVVYYGSDRTRFRPASKEEKLQARHGLGLPVQATVVAFIGAMGDNRKGFDTVYKAWKLMRMNSNGETHLVVVGAGAQLTRWKPRAHLERMASTIHFLGFRHDVPNVLRACDILVAPSRYEAYGLAVHEALCCGVPALVSRHAGVAEQYPPSLTDYLISDPNDPKELAGRIELVARSYHQHRSHLAQLAARLRNHTWDHMAEQIQQHIDATRSASNASRFAKPVCA